MKHSERPTLLLVLPLLVLPILISWNQAFNQDGGSLKENLDLPYDAAGAEEEEEDAPEIIYFYGESYEADAVVFALDESGSMAQHGRWELQMREVTRALSELSERTEFGLVFYASQVTAFREHPVEASAGNRRAGLAFVRSRQPNGDTCLGEGVIKALKIASLSQSRHRAVIVTSDGQPDNCATGARATPTEVERILQQTVAANPGLQIKVHTIWVGAEVELEGSEFMKRLADRHAGTFRKVTR